MDAESDLVRQSALVRDAELLRAADIQRQPRQRVLPVTINGNAANGVEGLYTSAASGAAPGTIVVKIVNPGTTARVARIDVGGGAAARATMTVLTGRATARTRWPLRASWHRR